MGVGNVKSSAREEDDRGPVHPLETATAPAESVTFNTTMNGPAEEYVCVPCTPDPELPSPKSHAKEYGGLPPTAVAVQVNGLPTVIPAPEGPVILAVTGDAFTTTLRHHYCYR